MESYRRRYRLSFIGGLLGFMFLVTIFIETTACAESGWFTCSVDLAGPGKIETFISLTDLAEEPVFVGKWFLFPVARAREMLAVALSAINSGKTVVVVVDPESGTYPVISDIYLCAK